MRWFWPVITTEEHAEASEPGLPFTDECVSLAQSRRRVLDRTTAGRVGAMLLAENRRSVDYRYAESEWEEPYVFTELKGNPDPIVVLKAIMCLRYQSCEHPEWESSEAYAFLAALEQRAIDCLPGMDDADGWGDVDADVFLRAVKRAAL